MVLGSEPPFDKSEKELPIYICESVSGLLIDCWMRSVRILGSVLICAFSFYGCSSFFCGNDVNLVGASTLVPYFYKNLDSVNLGHHFDSLRFVGMVKEDEPSELYCEVSFNDTLNEVNGSFTYNYCRRIVGIGISTKFDLISEAVIPRDRIQLLSDLLFELTGDDEPLIEMSKELLALDTLGDKDCVLVRPLFSFKNDVYSESLSMRVVISKAEELAHCIIFYEARLEPPFIEVE